MEIRNYLKFRTPIMHKNFFKRLSHNPDYVQTQNNDRNNPIHFA